MDLSQSDIFDSDPYGLLACWQCGECFTRLNLVTESYLTHTFAVGWNPVSPNFVCYP